MFNDKEYLEYLEERVNKLAAEAKTREGFIREILSTKGLTNMEKVNLDFRVTDTALSKLAPSLDNPIRIECFDGRYSLGDGGFLYMVSNVNLDGTFWAFDSKHFASDSVELKGLRSYQSRRLKSYNFSKDCLPKRVVVIRFDNQGRVIVVGSDGKPITSDLFPNGISMEVPFLG